MPSVNNARVLIVATDGFEEWELFGPREILQKRGAEVVRKDSYWKIVD